MKEKKNVSSLSDHRLIKKQGIVATPLNDALRGQLKFQSWTSARMPEYLWLALILMAYGRKDGFARAGQILLDISKNFKSLKKPKLSKILSLSDEDQGKIYEIICHYIDKEVLAPLTILYRANTYPIFNEYFYVPPLTVEKKIEVISKAIKLNSPHQSNEATDLRYLAISLQIFGGKIKIAAGLNGVFNALKEYPITEHEDEMMRAYRPTIRSMEGVITDLDDEDTEFSSKFWRDIGMITPCNPMLIQFDENPEDFNVFIRDCQKVLEYIFDLNKEESLSGDKFDVMVGSVNYALKIFIEITRKSLGNSILGRHGIRTIMEILIMMKYLLKKEAEKPGIWEEYKLYGISKYKLVLLKLREASLDKTSHVLEPIVGALVNEIQWEEFTDVDLKYFDQLGIREKSIEVGEKELYDLYYDYDSSFAHGLWGAVRESAMLPCDNASHRYHSVPDISAGQILPDAKSDSFKVMIRLFSLMAEIYEVPAWFLEKYEVGA